MNHEAEFREVLKAGDLKDAFILFQKYTPELRSAIPPFLPELTSQIVAEIQLFCTSPVSTPDDFQRSYRRMQIIGLATLMTGTFDEMKALPRDGAPFDEPRALVELLRTVPVLWIGDYVEFLAKSRPDRYYYRVLIDGGICRPPERDMTSYVTSLFAHRRELTFLEDNSAFLSEIVWKIFEIDGDSENSLSNHDKYADLKTERSWAAFLRALSERGKLPRARLLDSSLEALSRDFIQFRAGWFSHFFEFMIPTLDELIERKDRFVILLESTIGPTVSFALDALKKINKTGHLHTDDLVPQVIPALTSRTKKTQIGVLQLLEELLKKEPQNTGKILLTCVEGLISEQVEVQERIAKLLNKHPDRIDAAIRSRLAELRVFLSPTSLASLEKFLPKIEPAGTNEAAPLDPPLETAATSLIEPISTREELIEQASYLLENPHDWPAAERVLDGLTRMPLDSKLEKLAKPLLKRATGLFEKNAGNDYEFIPISTLSLAILNWLGSHPLLLDQALEDHISVVKNLSKHRYFTMRFHTNRLENIIRFIQKRSAIQLLCTPTHSGFFIDPTTLVQRVYALHLANLEPCSYDVVTAFLRLSLIGRELALPVAAKITGELGAALRYALGSDEPIGATADLWIAASRARYRNLDDPALARAFPNLGPGAATMPRVKLIPKNYSYSYDSNTTYTHNRLKFEVEPPPPTEIPETHLTIRLFSEKHCFYVQQERNMSHNLPDWVFTYLNSYWPTWREPVHLLATLCAGDHMKDAEVDRRGFLTALRALGDPEEEFHEFGRTLLNLGLSCPEPDGRTSAVQAFTTGISQGKLNPALLGQSMHVLFPLTYPARIRKSLDEIVRVSVMHRRAVFDYLTEVFKGDPTKAPDQMVKLFELYHELQVEFSAPLIDPETIAYLKAFPGGGRAAKLVKQILSFSK